MNFNNINKILKAIETKADSIGYDIDNNRDYKEAITIVVDVEMDNRSIKKGEMIRLTPRIAQLLRKLEISDIELIELLIA